MLKEARKRSNKTFVLGNVESLGFGASSFHAVFFVATLEFLTDYKKALGETWRVTKSKGKILVMTLNPESEYFKDQFKEKDSYFRRIKYTDLEEIKSYITGYYKIIKDEYFLGIRGKHLFSTSDIDFAGLRVLIGIKSND